MKTKHKMIFAFVGVLAVLALAGNTMNNLEAQRAKEAALAEEVARTKLAQEKRDALVADFQANRSALISEAQSLIGQGEPGAAHSLLEKYASLKDPDVTHLMGVAKQRAQTHQAIKDLSDELAGKPDNLRAMAIYTELARLEPSNPLWRALIEEKKPIVDAIKAQQLATEKAAARQSAVKLLFSPWDGSVRAVEEGIKARLKDPDSYKHVETRFKDPGRGDVTVVTQYRARNSFNAVITSVATAVVSPAGELISLEMHK